MKRLLIYVLSIVGFVCLTGMASPAAAVLYSVAVPQGALTRGQNVQIPVNVDPQGANGTIGVAGITYDPTVLQYTSLSPGPIVDTVDAAQPSSGKLLLVGKRSSAAITAGTFAYVNFTLVAQSSGSTELCTAFAPTQQELPQVPSTILSPDQYGSVLGISTVAAAEITSAPAPTTVRQLPVSGATEASYSAMAFAITAFVAFAAVHLYSLRK